jgi:regulator of protease activity HflC (stomatin/prohibitin superfamily)
MFALIGTILLGLLALLGITAVAKSIRIIGQAEVMVIERFGKFNRVARAGLNLLIPFVEAAKSIDVRYFEADLTGVKRVTSGSTRRIDLREQVLNFPSQPVITKDNVTIDIDAVLYYRSPEGRLCGAESPVCAGDTHAHDAPKHRRRDGARLDAGVP